MGIKHWFLRRQYERNAG